MGLLIMKDYLAIIRKLDFVDLFKYGRFGISYAVEFDGSIQNHANDDDLFAALTSRMNMYEYSFEYLIIHFKCQEISGQRIEVDIKDVQGLYTFDEEAKKEMSISFDPRIQLHVSPWADKFKNLQQELNIEQTKRGIDNLWAIWKLPKEDRAKCEELITPEIVKEVFRELYTYERPSGHLPVWVYLLRYERHCSYPKDKLGFFGDAIHVFCNYKEGKELDGEVAEGTASFSALPKYEPNFEPLYDIVKSTPFAEKTQEETHCRFAMVAPLFFFLKNKFADGMSYENKIISYSKEIGGFECSIAVYLLGLALGYDKTYDAFYETAELQFFKKRKEESSPSKSDECPKDVHDIETDNNGVGFVEEKGETEMNALAASGAIAAQQTSGSAQPHQGKLLFPGCEEEKKLPIAWMRKGNSPKTIKPAFNEEELRELMTAGYNKVEKFTDAVKKEIKNKGYDPEAEEKRLAKKKK